MAAKKGGLGRGLDSLFGENTEERKGSVTVKLSDIEPNRNQPRRDFDDETISQLADSIEKHGLIQPIVVRPNANGTYQIIAGERRWRACRIAGLYEVPVVIKETDDKSLMEMALIENLQREDLNPVDEAFGYKTLIDTYSLTQEQVAESIGKSRSAVTNSLRLLTLGEKELEALRNGSITSGHARAMVSVEDAERRERMLAAALNGASVRELEKMAKETKKAKEKKPAVRDTFFSEVEIALRSELHRRISVKSATGEAGTVTIEFLNKEDLKELAKKLTEE